ncbi:MAG TPA: hypothetical protein ENN76_02100 [Euryarchaeota archaeon]|nr:hypothetical protein [Euryarchaeota archaeon]
MEKSLDKKDKRDVKSMFLFVTVVSVVTALVTAFVGIVASLVFSNDGKIHMYVVFGFLSITLLIMLGQMTVHLHYARWMYPLYFISSMFMGAIPYLLVASFFSLFILIILYVFNIVPDKNMLVFLRAGFLWISLPPICWGVLAGRLLLIKRLKIPKEVSKRSKILHISDLHLGLLVGKGRLSRIKALVNSERPDIMVISGDFIDVSPKHLEMYEDDIKKLTGLVKTYAVTGNHEYYNGLEDAVSWMRNMGITVLRNETVIDDGTGLIICGVDDPQIHGSGYEDMLKTLMGRDDVDILLSHQPLLFGQLATDRSFLMLSGHTHHGQLWPMSIFTKLLYKDGDRGLVKKGASFMYVSAGAGTWGPPLRVGSFSEMALLEIG